MGTNSNSQTNLSDGSGASVHTMVNGTNNMANGMQPLGPGKYTVVGIDIDTTGRRLIDEIVQLAAYTANDHFEQYIMPYMNLNPAARQRHQVRVISIGFYRMLKSMQTYKIIKSKSEIAAIKDFLDWLDDVKAKDKDSQGIILVYHEERKFIPYMILESLKKYGLLDKFAATVKSFANGLQLAKATLNNDNVQQLTLRRLTRVLSQVQIAVVKATSAPNATAMMNEIQSTTSNGGAGGGGNGTNDNCNGNISPVGDGSQQQQQQQQHQMPQQQMLQDTLVSSSLMTPGGDNNNNTIQEMNKNRKTSRSSEHVDMFDGNASVRARLAYEIAFKLSLREQREPIESEAAYDKMLQALRTYAYPIYFDLNELQTQTKNLERQNSFRPIFLHYFKTTLYHRVRAVKFRIILAENGYDLQGLNNVWNANGKQGIIDVLHSIKELKLDEKFELADLFDSFYDPAKSTIKPVVRNNNRRRNRRGMRGNNMSNKNNGNGGGQPSNMEQGAGGDKQNISVAPSVSTAGQLPDSSNLNKSYNVGQHQNQHQPQHGGNNIGNSNGNNSGGNGGGGSKPQRRRPRRNNFRNQQQGGMPSAPSQANVGMPIAASN